MVLDRFCLLLICFSKYVFLNTTLYMCISSKNTWVKRLFGLAFSGFSEFLFVLFKQCERAFG